MTAINDIIGSLKPIANIIGAVLLAWIALRQAKLNKVITVLEKNTNSMKDALVAVTAQKSHAEGALQGKAEQIEAGTTEPPRTDATSQKV